MGFKTVSLDELPIDIIDGDRGKNYPNGSDFSKFGYCLFLSAKNITKDGFSDSEKQFITEEKDNLLRKGKLKFGDIILTTRGTVGNLFLYDERTKYKNIRINSGMVIMRCSEEVDNYYIYHLMKSNAFQQQIMILRTGSAQPQLPITIMKKLIFTIPSLKEQKKIAKILSSIDKKIEINNELNENLKKISQELYKHWFINFEFPDEKGRPYKSSGGKMIESELGMIPEGWEIKSVKDIAKCVLGGTPSRGNPDFWNGNIAWINSGKINEFRILEPTEYITELGLKKSSTVLLPKKTTVIAITGATLGQVSILEIDSCANQSVIGIIGNDSKMSEYIYLLISDSIMNIISRQTGGAQQHINKNDVESFKVLVPNKVIIEKFHEVVNPLFKKISLNCFESKNLKNLNTTLLPELLNGTINVENIEL